MATPDNLLSTKRCDLICMVLGQLTNARETNATSSSSNGSAAETTHTLMVWDGTARGGTPLLNADGTDSLDTIRSCKYIDASMKVANLYVASQELNSEIAMKVKQCYQEALSQDPSASLLGAQLPIIIGDSIWLDRMRSLKPGMWIRVRNLHLDTLKTSSSTSSPGLNAEVMTAALHGDSHLSVLYPYFT